MPRKDYYWIHKEKLAKEKRDFRNANLEDNRKKEQEYREKNRIKTRLWLKSYWKYVIKQKLGCCVCGFTLALDFCHIHAKRDGGKMNKSNITLLCPNHHRLFDQHKLSRSELILIKPLNKL